MCAQSNQGKIKKIDFTQYRRHVDHKIEMKSKKNASDYDKMLDIQTVLTNRSKIDIKVLNKYMYQKYCYDYINMR